MDREERDMRVGVKTTRVRTLGNELRSKRPHGSAFVLAAVLLTFGALTFAPAALAAEAAPPPKLWRTCEKGLDAGQCEFPWGVVSDPQTGHLYVADNANARLNELTAWGEFVKSWGWGVRDGSPELQTCTTQTGCLKGLEGAGAGQLSSPTGIALDSSGDIYVVDHDNLRVQKFDPEGHFLLTFGGNVNKTKVEEGGTEAQQNLCTAASGNACQKGTTGTGNGQFGSWSFGAFIAVGPDDTVYVGDQNRIQEFSTEGAYKGEIALPGETVWALASDPDAEQLYLASTVNNQKNVRKISLSGETVCTTEGFFGVRSIATDSTGRLYVVGAIAGDGNSVQVIDSDCTADDEVGPLGLGELSNSSFVGVGSACLTSGDNIYVANGDPGRPDGHFVSAYGPPPDKIGLCPPPPTPPDIEAEFAASVDTTGALLKAKINPRFWADTAYYLEYGSQPCSEGGCEQKPLPPGASLGAGAVGSGVTVAVRLEGLAPGASYHYRFVATSHCIASEPEEECTTVGAERAFTTFAIPTSSSSECGNEASRIGFGGLLPDCRAYEMVSPVDKQGGDIRVLEGETGMMPLLEQSSDSGEKLAYSSARAFGDAVSAPYTSQYIAQRVAGEEWQTHSINPPRGTPVVDVLHQVNPEFKAFSADLCDGWQFSYAEGALAEGALAGNVNLYRRSDRLCGEEGYEALAPIVVPQTPSGKTGMAMMGVSADGAAAIFLADGKLAPNASAEENQIYESAEGGPPVLVCVLPSGAAWSDDCIAGSQDAKIAGGGGITGADLGGAISSDGRRVFWSDESMGNGNLYLRENPAAPESARLHGAASGKGNLIGPAVGTGNVVSGSEFVKSTKAESGAFAVGQEISSANGGIPAKTTVVKIEETAPGVFTLTLSAKVSAGKTKLGDVLTGAASATVSGLSTESGAFAVSQEISAPGIPPATTVVACSPSCGLGATSLTLSAKSTKTNTETALEATSPCTEAATKACTMAVSRVAEGEAGTEKSAFFWGSADDGSKAIFTTGSIRTGGVIDDGRLYSFEPDGETTELLAKGVLGVMGMSTDADRVYFASEDEIPGSGENSEHEEAEAGKANLYLYEAGGGGSTSFVGTLAQADLVEDISTERFSERSAVVSSDGAHAAFASVAPLTGYDNTAADAASCVGSLCKEVYRFDANTKQMTCASCNPSGARPVGSSSIPLLRSAFHAARVLTEDGSRLYFESGDALTPRDTNGQMDVYQWEAPGAGTCTESLPAYSLQDEGCIDLVSSGQSHLDSRFVEADPSGENAFIATASSLLPQDPDGVDIYDARVGGGLPIPQGPPPSCEGEACQGPLEAPNDPTPSSLTFEGAGNVVEEPSAVQARCAKGKVRRRGHCVAKKHHKRHKRRAAGSNRGVAR